MATTNVGETHAAEIKWLVSLTMQDRARAMNGLCIGWPDARRTALEHAVSVATRATCCCINCIRAAYRAAGRSLPCAYGAAVCTHAQCQGSK